MHLRLVLHIERSGGFVQQNDRRILQQRTRDGDALALATGKLAAVFADHGVVALGHTAYELVAIRRLRRSQHLFVGGIVAAQADVAHNRVVEQQHVLEHDGVTAQQGFGINRGNIHAAHGNCARRGIPETRRQAAHRRLTRTAGANQRGDLAFLCREAHVFQHLVARTAIGARTVAEGNVVEHHIVAGRLEIGRAAGNGLFHDAAHALGGSLGGKQLCHQHQRLVERRVNAAYHQQEREHHHEINLPCSNHGGTCDKRGGNA